jgi:hypothetical protein
MSPLSSVDVIVWEGKGGRRERVEGEKGWKERKGGRRERVEGEYELCRC